MADTMSEGGQAAQAAPAARRGARGRDRRLVALAWVLAAVAIAPVASVVAASLVGDWATWASLARTVLPEYALNTLSLAALVGLGTMAVGTGAAWLVTNCSFPGRRVLEVALALPLAFPAYVLAYAYTTLLDHPGPVQTGLRAVTGWGPRDYWFPEIRSLGGAALMLVLVFYPYVYLLVRAALLQQSVAALQVARTLGSGPWRAALTVTLPMARPAIFGGVMLALMETIADFGTVAHFGVPTFSTGIYKAWFSMGDRVAAAQLSLCLLGGAVLLAAVERISRGGRRDQAGSRYEALPVIRLRGWRAALAATLCALPVLVGFAVPLAMLGGMALEAGTESGARYGGRAWNSISLAAGSAVLIVAVAVLIGYARRLAPGRGARVAHIAAGLGYAVPGGVIAVGLLVPLGAFDRWLDAFMRAQFGTGTGLLVTGSVAVLVLAYLTRFMAVALNAVEAGLTTIRRNVDHASRVLGCSGWAALGRVHLPLLSGSLMTGALIVFVEVMKELPATLILRPFNFDTLAVEAYRLASDERLAEAALPSLAIVAFGLIPVVILSRRIARSRPGHG